MQSKGRVSTRFIAAAAAIIAAQFITSASPAGADNSAPGHVTFSQASPHYRYDGAHGTFTGDAVYAAQSPDGGNRLIWSLRLSESVQALIVGDMACGATVSGKRGYADDHPQIPKDYFWHSVVPELQIGTTYKLFATCHFTASNGSTTAPGHADFTIEFTLT